MNFVITRPVVVLFAVLVIIWPCVAIIHRCFFSPLRNVPGPRFAAASSLWLWWRDVAGTSPVAIKRLHKRYGPVVRISPNELSIDDSDVHNNILYSHATDFMKAPYFYDTFSSTSSKNSFTTDNRHEHATLRRLESKTFARRSILDFEPQIQTTLNNLSTILSEKCETSALLDLSKAFRCLALDFITQFAYGENWRTIRQPDFQEPLLDAFDGFASGNFLFTICPMLRQPALTFLSTLPLQMMQAIPKMIKAVDRALEANKDLKETPGFISLLSATRIAAAKQNIQLPLAWLHSEGVGTIFAGTDTTSTTLTLTMLEIFGREEIYNPLHAELKEAIPDPTASISVTQLEALPYLSACVKEGLRYSCPVRSRLPRIVPGEGWTFREHFIPAGTIVSSSPYLQNYNEEVFPDPFVFKPERWLTKDPAELQRLTQTQATFSKGSRQCGGINLATTEVYHTLATMARRFKLKEKRFKTLKVREIFGVVFDTPVDVVLALADD